MNKLEHTVIYYTADIVVKPELGQISGGNNCQRLAPVNMKVLKVLLDNAGRVVSRNDLFEKVWTNQVVSDDTLTRAVSDIRSLLKAISNQSKLIETVPKKGYRWLAESKMQSAELLDSGELIAINKDRVDEPIPKKTTGSWQSFLGWSLVAIILMALFTTATIWLTKYYLKNGIVKVAFLPINSVTTDNSQLANAIEEELKTKILVGDRIRFLSASVTNSPSQAMLPFITREFSAQWLIEISTRTQNQVPRVTINLVDASNGLVLGSVSKNITHLNKDLDSISAKFIDLMYIKTD